MRPARRPPVRDQLAADAAVGLGKGHRERTHRRGEFGCGLRLGGVVTQPAHHGVAALAARIELARSGKQRRRQRGRHPQVELQREDRPLETLRGHPDDRQRQIIDANRLTDHGRRAAEIPLPIVVGQHHDRLRAWPLDFIRPDETPGHRLQFQRGEKVSGHELRVSALGSPGFTDVERRHAKRHQLFDRRQLRLEIAVLGPRHARIGAGVGLRVDVDRTASCRRHQESASAPSSGSTRTRRC